MGDVGSTDGGVDLSKEVRSVSSTGAEKGVKPEHYALIPVEALRKVASLYGKGAEKYSAHNWRLGYEWSKSYSALMRHANQFWGGEDLDPETGLPHLAAVVFHAMTLMTFMEEQTAFDDRYTTKRCYICNKSVNNGLHDLSDPKLGHK